MNDRTPLGPWIRRFLLEHVVAERNLARNTQTSYRDTLALLLPFLSATTTTSVDRLAVEDLSPGLLRRFLEGHRRANVLDAVHVGPVAAFQEHAGVGAPPVALGEDGVEGQR